MRSIVSSAVRFRVLVAGAAVAVMVYGFVQLPSAPVDTLPEYSPPYVEVQTEALGLSAEEVEQLITVPLEADLLNGVAWLESIESRSVQGLSSIVLTFEPGTDPIRARQMVAERLTQAHAIPNVSKPPVMLQPLSSANRLMMVSLASEDHSLIELSVLARWNIRPRLMGVPGVANVAIWGQRERQLQVLVDPRRIHDAGVTLDEVVETAGNALWVSPLTYLEASTPGTGGFIDTPQQRLGVQHIFPIDTADDLARIAIESTSDERVLLGDVAEVVEDHQPLIGDAIVDGAPGLLLVIEKFPEANALEVTAAVEEALVAMAPGLPGVVLDPSVYRSATYIESAIETVSIAALVGMLLLAVAVAGLLRDWRSALVVLTTVPLSLVAAALVLLCFGATVNMMVVAGLVAALTIVVDEAVVSATETRRRLREAGAEGPARQQVAIRGVVEVRGPVVFATCVLALAIAPLFLLGEVTGAFLPSMLAAYLVAIVVAMIVALTVAPALIGLLAGERGLDRPEGRAMSRVQARYRSALARIVERPRGVSLTAGAVTVGVVALFALSMAPPLGQAGPPTLEDRDLLIHWDGAPGTSHTEMTRIVAAASGELRQLDGVRNVGAHVGRAIASDRVVAVNSGEIWLSIDESADYGTTLAAVQAVVAGYPGLAREVLTYPAERTSQVLAPADDVIVRVFGQDLASMRAKAAEIAELMATIDGIAGAQVEPVVDEPTIQIAVDLDAARRYGLTPGEVRRASATLLSGIEVGSLFEEQKVFEVVVWGAPALRQSLTDIQDLPIETPEGGLIPLSAVADVSVAPEPTIIRRAGVQRVIDVTGSIVGRDASGVVAELKTALAGVDFALESHAEVLGITADRQARLAAIIAVATAALAGMFLVLHAAFGSWRSAGLVLIAMPASLAGALVVALAIGSTGALGALIGALAVLGLSVRSGVLLVERYRQLGVMDGQLPPEAVIGGASDRLPAFLVTTLAVAAAMLPFAAMGTRSGLEILHPMALVVLGGLVSSTLVNLFVVPAILLRSGLRPSTEMVPIQVEAAPAPQVIGAR